MKVNIMELQGTMAIVADGNGRPGQTVQWMPGASSSGGIPGAPSIRVHSVNGLLATDS
jgi:hypothetical protein